MKTVYEAPKLDNLSLRSTNYNLLDVEAWLAGHHILSIHLLNLGGGGS